MLPPYTQAWPGVISTASFWSNLFTYNQLIADQTISQSARIAGGLGFLKRGTVLIGPAPGLPITATTLLTTAPGTGVARCILAADIDTTAGPVTGLVYTAGSFISYAMTFTSQGAQLDAAQLWQFSAFVLTVLQRSGLLVPMMNLPTTGGPLPAGNEPGWPYPYPYGATKEQMDATKAATKEQVEAIREAMSRYRPGMESVPIAGMGPHTRATAPAWAIAAFGEAEPTAAEKAREDLEEQGLELGDKQEKARQELAAKQQKELADLMQKQAQERAEIDKKRQEAVAKQAQEKAPPAARSNPTPKPTEPPANPKR